MGGGGEALDEDRGLITLKVAAEPPLHDRGRNPLRQGEGRRPEKADI